MKRHPFNLFLDFDGVTHPMPFQIPTSINELVSKDINGNGPFFCRKNVVQVNRLIHKLDAQVVISSSWRLDFGWKPFKPLFMGRVIGQTPWLDNCRRHDEVFRYLEQHGITDSAYLILDDNGGQFPDNAPLHVTDSNVGLTADEVDTILSRY
jgi:hypothetical protein